MYNGTSNITEVVAKVNIETSELVKSTVNIAQQTVE
jgi:hypothetical protein